MKIAMVVVMMASLVGGSVEARPGMDTDLLHSSASFIGEDTVDASGFSVAGAGEVNGEGFDDVT